MKKLITLALAAAGCALGTGAAHAGNVYWSVGINLPPVGTVVSNAPPPVYAPAPVYVPAPVVVAPPPPVYVVPPRVVYRPAPVYVPAPVVYRPVPVVAYPHRHKHRGEWRGHRHEHRDEYGTVYRDGRWDDGRRQRHDRYDRYDRYDAR
ncbi:MAG TPA: hypothetical protein VFZ93_08295 [Albitalea sp.]